MPTDFVTPDTTSFLILGLVVTLGTLLGYVASIVLRFRSARSDEDTLRELQS